MKRFRLTYFLLAILCTTYTSCIQIEDVSGEEPGNGDVKVVLTLNFPEITFEGETLIGDASEQYINDIHLYLFNSADDTFIEKVDKLSLNGMEGDVKRSILGILKNSHADYPQGIDIVLLANLNARNITPPELTKGDAKTSLYNQLVFSYKNPSDWQFKTSPKQYIPMWGTCSLNKALQEGYNNGGSITLTRAIARIDVVLNGGQGFDYFRLTNIKVCKYNTQGYSAPLDENASRPSIPTTSSIQGPLTFTATTEAEKRFGLQGQIYIPEYNNKGLQEVSYLELTGVLTTASSNSQITKTYRIDFKKDGKGEIFDLLRNNLYKFNITNISREVETTIGLSYVVEKWETIDVVVPPFN